MSIFRVRYISSLGKFNLVINGISYLFKPLELEQIYNMIKEALNQK
jgi:hypothetical protein